MFIIIRYKFIILVVVVIINLKESFVWCLIYMYTAQKY